MLENIYDVLRRPQYAFVRIAEQENLWKAAMLQLCILIINVVVNKSGTDLSIVKQVVYFVMAIPLTAFFWCLSAAITHGIAHLLGGSGTWKKQLIALSYSMLPEIIFVPLQVAALQLGLVQEVIAILALVSCLWCLVLAVYAVKSVQKLSTARSALVVLMPSLVVLIIVVVLVFMAMVVMR